MTNYNTPQTETFVKPTQAMSLVELRQIKFDWLTVAKDNGYLEAARMVARTLGRPFAPKYWECWTGYEWQAENVTVTFYEGTANWLPFAKAYNRVTVITALVDGRLVCYYRQSDDPLEAPDNFFVPGAWVDLVLSNLEAARTKERGRSLTLVEKERRQLLAQLQIGAEV